jgi:1,2-diacylglycerol 3-alpha-glucosyltransferase
MVALLARGLAACGHRVVLVAPRGPGPRAATYEVRSVAALPAIRLRLALPGPGELTRLLRRERVDLVHTHTEGPLGWSARAAAARLDLPAVHTLHTLYRHYLHYVAPFGLASRPATSLLDVGLRRFLRGFDLVLAPSARGRADVARLAPGVAVAVVPNGVPAPDTPATSDARQRQRLADLRARLRLGAHDRLLLVVGRVAPEKRSEELLAALLPVVATRPQLRVVLAGGGPLLQRTRRTVAARGLDHQVLLPGYLPHADVLALYQLAAVLVSASRSENHPVSLLEAAAAGVPAVVRRDAGLEDLVSPGTGIVADDDRSLALAAASLAADRVEQQRLGAGARRAARGWSDTAHVAATRRGYLVAGDVRAPRGASTAEAAPVRSRPATLVRTTSREER